MRLFTFGLLFAIVAAAQTPISQTPVPKLVRFSGTSHYASSTEGVTLAVYREQTGGAPLWQEVQNVDVDAEGRYSLLMGSTLNDGMPMELFRSGEPRWLGVQFNRPGASEEPRVMLVSVPYALKASDADTLGGKPASAYLLAETLASSVSGVTSPTASNNLISSTSTTSSAVSGNSISSNVVKPRVSSGSPSFVGKFANATDLINSSMYETGGNVGISTTTPLISLDVRTGALPQMGIAGTTDYLTFFASDQFGPAIYWDPAKDMRFGKGGASLYNPFGFVEQMRIQSSTGNVGIGTTTPGSRLDVAGDVNFSGALRFQATPVLQFGTASSVFGGPNLSVGLGALRPTAIGPGNTAVGNGALQNDADGYGNTAVGDSALQDNLIGFTNVGIGSEALQFNTTGNDNTAVGAAALNSNISGSNNTAVGFTALELNTTGVGNTAIGYNAGFPIRTGNSNVLIGVSAGNGLSTNASGNIIIGTGGTPADSGTIRIGQFASNFFASGIRGVTTANNDAIPVMIDSAGQLGTVSSSRRFKEDIHDMGDSSSDLMRLRPVTYRYRQPFADGSKPVQYGLIAEEVAEVYPDLVAHSADGQIETVKYQVLDSMLLNEVQRLQAEIKKLEERLAHLESKPEPKQ